MPLDHALLSVPARPEPLQSLVLLLLRRVQRLPCDARRLGFAHHLGGLTPELLLSSIRAIILGAAEGLRIVQQRVVLLYKPRPVRATDDPRR